MANCERIMSCPFFSGKIKRKNNISKAHILEYCFGNKHRCARYLVLTKLGKEAVPIDLFPGEMDRAEDIIAVAGTENRV